MLVLNEKGEPAVRPQVKLIKGRKKLIVLIISRLRLVLLESNRQWWGLLLVNTPHHRYINVVG